jgi:hypothetical protein
MAILADRLVSGVKKRIVMPSSQALYDNDDILQFADDVIGSRMIPIMESVQQNYFVYVEEEELVGGTSVYSVPYRAIGRALRELKIKDANNNIRNLAQIALEDSQVYNMETLQVGFYFIGDKFRLVPDVPSNIEPELTLMKWYRLPPNQLVQSSDAALVVSISGDNVTVADVPTNLEAGVEIDFIQGRSGNTIYEMDVAIASVNGNIISFAADAVPDDLRAGDYISLAQTSPVVNFIPNEAYSLLEGLTARRILQAIGDFDNADRIDQDNATEEKNLKMILEPRIDGEPTIIINRQGLVRGNKYLQRSWLYGQ